MCPLEPEVDGEVAVEEQGICRPSILHSGNELVGHFVIDRLVVELGGDDDVLVADIARHDVFVELKTDVIAVAQYAVGRRRCGDVAWPHVVLHHRHLATVHVDVIGAIRRRGVGSEGVVALRIEIVIVHVEV